MGQLPSRIGNQIGTTDSLRPRVGDSRTDHFDSQFQSFGIKGHKIYSRLLRTNRSRDKRFQIPYKFHMEHRTYPSDTGF